MNLLKQFTLGQRRAKAFAIENHLQLNDRTSIDLIEHLLDNKNWQNPQTQAVLSFVILQTAYRYYAFSDRLLNQACKPENAHLYSLDSLNTTLLEMADTLRFYQQVEKIQPALVENNLMSIQDATNHLFAIVAAQFPNQLSDLELHWHQAIETLQPFARDETTYEPAFSPTHEEFMQAVDKTQCIFAPTGKYWGADEWNEKKSFDENMAHFAQGYFRFMTLAKKEQFKGYAFRFPAKYSDSLEALSKTVAQVLSSLSKIDPAKSDCLKQDIDAAGWKFRWAGEAMFLTAFGTCYPEKHARNPYGFEYTYFFFQPDFVLRKHPGLTDGREKQSRERILKNFTRNEMPYDNAGKENEVQRYIRPLNPTDPAVRWWDYLS